MITRPSYVPDYRPQLVAWLNSQASMYGIDFIRMAMWWIHEHSVHGNGAYWAAHPNQNDYDWVVANLWGQVPEVSNPALAQRPEMLCGNYAELLRQLNNLFTGDVNSTGLVVLTSGRSFIDPASGHLSFQDHVVIEVKDPGSGRYGVIDADYGVSYINASGPFAGQVATVADLLAPCSPEEFRESLIPWASPSDYGWNNPKVRTEPDPNRLVAADFFANIRSARRCVSVTNKARVDPSAMYQDQAGVVRPFRNIINDWLTARGGTRADHFEV